jgi:hypothetical protein
VAQIMAHVENPPEHPAAAWTGLSASLSLKGHT